MTIIWLPFNVYGYVYVTGLLCGDDFAIAIL